MILFFHTTPEGRFENCDYPEINGLLMQIDR